MKTDVVITLPRELVREKNSDALTYLDIRAVPEAERQMIRVSGQSRYGDNTWSFRDELGEYETRHLDIRFDGLVGNKDDIAYAERLSQLKEFTYSLIVSPPPSRPKLTTIISYYGKGIALFMRFLVSEDIRSFDEVTERDMERYLSWCAALPNANEPTKQVSAQTLTSRTAGLSWIFQQRKKIARGLGVNPWANETQNQWAERTTKTKIGEKHTVEMPDDVARQVVLHAIADIRNYDCYFKAAAAYKKFKKDGGKLGFDWTSFGFSSHFEWSAFPSHITAAAYALIACFSGMRVHEVLNIRETYRDQLSGVLLPYASVEDVESEGVVRQCYFIRSVTTKLEKVPKITRWQVAPIAIEAAKAVIAMRAQYRGSSGFLFASRFVEKQGMHMNTQAANEGLQSFAARHDIRWQGKIWHLKTHQFRKKFARMMVRQGLGIREIQDQLKHIDIEMTKIYGDMHLHDELRQEKFVLSREQYEELLRGSTPLIGGGADEMTELRHEFIGKTREDQEKMLDTLTNTALIDAVDFGFCLYNPKRAKCGGSAQNCKPADCVNSIIPLDTAVRHLEGRKRRNAQLLRALKSPLAKAHILETQDATIRLLEQADRVHSTAELKSAIGAQDGR